MLTPDVFTALEATPPGRNQEIQLTDALDAMLEHTPMVAVPFVGSRYDIGNKADYLAAILALAGTRGLRIVRAGIVRCVISWRYHDARSSLEHAGI